MQHIIDRFISYVTIDTESDASSNTTPSTKKQLVLANLLVEELKKISGFLGDRGATERVAKTLESYL